MGYLNNTTRVLDAILTKRGREILSTGGAFEVAKFALGDDEIDYGLWDTTHAKGTDYYGAVIENLPALEPFNDPSEIMKYKLVTRTEGTRAMASLIEQPPSSQSNLNSLKWYSEEDDNTRVTFTGTFELDLIGYSLGVGDVFGVKHKDNANAGASDYEGGDIWPGEGYKNETYTITLLDASVAVLAPASNEFNKINAVNISDVNDWISYVKVVQHVSQTIKNVEKSNGGFRKGNFGSSDGRINIYPKQLSSDSSIAKTSIICTGESSGAVYEFDVTVTYTVGSVKGNVSTSTSS